VLAGPRDGRERRAANTKSAGRRAGGAAGASGDGNGCTVATGADSSISGSVAASDCTLARSTVRGGGRLGSLSAVGRVAIGCSGSVPGNARPIRRGGTMLGAPRVARVAIRPRYDPAAI
jgi:hypothetical protein